ncbi:MAG: BON domain-containing protein [Chroococcales cyanobacterium]
MGWLQRIFGFGKPENAKVSVEETVTNEEGEEVPPERVGLNGEYDQSGLAKRVTLAFDEESDLDDIDTLWVAQTGSTVVLKGKVPSQDILDKMVEVAMAVDGATEVNTDQVEVEG